jgi:hypothetical protein
MTSRQIDSICAASVTVSTWAWVKRSHSLIPGSGIEPRFRVQLTHHNLDRPVGPEAAPRRGPITKSEIAGKVDLRTA